MLGIDGEKRSELAIARIRREANPTKLGGAACMALNWVPDNLQISIRSRALLRLQHERHLQTLRELYGSIR